MFPDIERYVLGLVYTLALQEDLQIKKTINDEFEARQSRRLAKMKSPENIARETKYTEEEKATLIAIRSAYEEWIEKERKNLIENFPRQFSVSSALKNIFIYEEETYNCFMLSI